MTRYLILVFGVLVVFLASFLVAEAFSPPLLDDPASWLPGGGLLAGVAGVGLLVADVVLPVPSSLVMVVHGALFGVAVGTALSLLGGVGSALAGYGLGRWGGPPLLRSVCSETERDRADRLVRRWGLLAVTATRPVPLLAETVAVVAGASSLGSVRTTVAATAGSIPAALLYAVAGSLGIGAPSGLVVFAVVIAIAASLWIAGGS
ncbi:MAG: TVP38/TMEM64 family protein [Pseudonocardiaceae bacterium]